MRGWFEVNDLAKRRLFTGLCAFSHRNLIWRGGGRKCSHTAILSSKGNSWKRGNMG